MINLPRAAKPPAAASRRTIDGMTRTTITLWVLALVAPACLPGAVPAATPPGPPDPLDCPPVHGVGTLLEEADLVLVGEQHGTVESPAFVAALACLASRGGREVAVGFELTASEEGRFAAYLESDGGAAARAELLAGAPWRATGSGQYGATSEAMLGLLESLRLYRAAGRRLGFALFNRSGAGGSQARDRRMAETLGAIAAGRPEGGLLIALTGNIHSRLAPGTRWAPDYEPMGYLVRRDWPDLRVVSLDVAHAGGSAWLCTPEGCGERRLRPRGEPAGDRFTITRHGEVQPDGHHGRYWVGEIHASPPAVGAAPDGSSPGPGR